MQLAYQSFCDMIQISYVRRVGVKLCMTLHKCYYTTYTPSKAQSNTNNSVFVGQTGTYSAFQQISQPYQNSEMPDGANSGSLAKKHVGFADSTGDLGKPAPSTTLHSTLANEAVAVVAARKSRDEPEQVNSTVFQTQNFFSNGFMHENSISQVLGFQ